MGENQMPLNQKQPIANKVLFEMGDDQDSM